MLEFFTEIGENDFPVWVSGNFDDDDHFIAETVFPRNAASVNILDALMQPQFDQIERAADKARAGEYQQWKEDRAADLYADRMAA